MSETGARTAETPPHRYGARLAGELERKWQDRWEADRTFWTPNPSGPLADGFERVGDRQKLYVLDMFPYPSGAGLHVGHPLGYIGTDVFARFKRMTGHNVLHAMGYDAFGLPAEQYAVTTGQHPRATTDENIATMRRQLRRLGLGHDPRRGVSTTDVSYYRWTQWIFLQMFDGWYDDQLDRARPIDELIGQFESGERATPDDRSWSELDRREQRELVDSFRLAYLEEATVNWCPALGTVLANEEVTAEGRSERGNHRVYKRPLKQWKLRITTYAERLLADLHLLEWPESIKVMQRNWIGRSEGADIVFSIENHEDLGVRVFTTRPDTVFGATYMVLAPELELLDEILPNEWPLNTELTWKGTFDQDRFPPDAIAAYREFAASKTDLERQAEDKQKTGIFTGAFAINPVNDERIPIFVADYVLAGYGTGAIMAVPGQDQRDWDFAQEFDLPIIRTVQPPPGYDGEAFLGDGLAINSGFLDGLDVPTAKARIIEWLEEHDLGEGSVTYKLRDWLFSRQRYWGEPFPIVYDADDLPVALPESMLPVELPDMDDFEPRIVAYDEETLPEPPLARAARWAEVELDLGDGPAVYRRETNTMPQWAGSCWYYLRYLDPTNENRMVDPEVERYWMTGSSPSGGIDLYVGGAEHAVLHLLYARFWHKVLFDLGHVSTPEPFGRLFNQGTITAAEFTDERGAYVDAAEVEERDGRFFFEGREVIRAWGRMGKSRKNAIAPDQIYEDYGADTLRLYEMFMGPLDASRPWSTTDIVGVYRFLQRFWRNAVDEETGALRVAEHPLDDQTNQVLHRTIAAVREDMRALQFNTAIARLFELNNHLTQLVTRDGTAPVAVVEAMALMLAPLAPHVAEEIWERLGHDASLAYEAFPEADPAFLVEEVCVVVVQVNGKVRAQIEVPAGASDEELEAAARADARVAAILDATEVVKVIVVPGRLVNFVTAK